MNYNISSANNNNNKFKKQTLSSSSSNNNSNNKNNTNSPTIKKVLVVKKLKQIQKPKNYEDLSWNNLSLAISSIHKKESTTSTLEELYKIVESMCLDNNMANSLYSKIMNQIENHITNLFKQSLTSSMISDPILFLKLINSIWKDHTDQMIMIRNIFLYLDRTFVIQNSSNFKSIWDMGLQFFGTNLKNHQLNLQRKVIDSLLYSIRCEREGDEVDRDLIYSLVKMLSSLNVYSNFEIEFIKESNRFYDMEGNIKINEFETSVYLKYVSERLAQEGERLMRYLEPSTKKSLTTVLERQLIERHVDIILEKGFSLMVTEDRLEDLGRLYQMLNSVGAILKLKQSWSVYIKAKGVQMLNEKEKESTLIQDLLDYKDRLDKILSISFQKNETLTYSLKESFEYFINTKQNKPAELVAKFIDSKLKVGSSSGGKKMTEDELEALLNKSLILFRYIQGKDVFEAFYKQDLSKRLLLDKSTSIDAEKSMISKLKTECGTTFTAKLEDLFLDMELSKDLMNSFKDSSYIQNIKSIEMNVYVLANGSWPIQPSTEVVHLPTEFLEYQQIYTQFYISKHSGRSLKWQNALSYCVLKANFQQSKKELSVSLFQTIILFLFNNSDADLTFKYIQTQTGLSTPELKKNLLSLCSSKSEILIRSRSPSNNNSSTASKTIDENDIFSFNHKFTHKLFKIKVNNVQIQETVEENQKTNENIINDRQYQVDCAIVRIMKTRKTLAHNLLISELITLLKFQPKPADLKKRIEILIEKEFLMRDPLNANQYNYMA